MNRTNIINKFKRCLLKENYYDFKYNPYKFLKKKINLKQLFDNKENSSYDNNNLNKFNDSLTTVEAMNNPRLKRIEKNLDIIEFNNYKFKRKTTISSKKNYTIKTLNIHKYSDCVLIPQKTTSNKGKRIINLNLYRDIEEKKINKRSKTMSAKLGHEREKVVNIKNNLKINNNNLNIYNDIKFKDTLSAFLYHINHFISEPNKGIKTNNDIDNKILRIYNLRNNLNNKEIKEIKRFDVDLSNIFLIKKPLMPTIRGKILKNLKKRFKKPIRNIIRETIFENKKNN